MHEAELCYDIDLIRQAVFAYWKRTVGFGLPIVGLLLLANFCFFVARGDRSWIVGVDAVGVLLIVVFAISLYVVHYRHAVTKLREMDVPRAKFLAEEGTFTLESELGRSTMRWTLVKELRRYPRFWLVVFSNAQFVTFPLNGMSSEMQAYVVARIRAAGGKVI